MRHHNHYTSIIALILFVTTTRQISAFSPSPNKGMDQSTTTMPPVQVADPSSSLHSSSLYDWEQRSILEQRIEHGMYYEHQPTINKKKNDAEDSHVPRVQAVFCAYRRTAEDYQRLKSAHPDDDRY